GGAQAEHEDQQADDDRQHGLLDEQIGELHRMDPSRARGPIWSGRPGRMLREFRPGAARRTADHCSCGVGFASFFGARESSISNGVPFFSLSWPLVTTSMPSSVPDSTATCSPRVGPVVTNTCCAVGSAGLPSASL